MTFRRKGMKSNSVLFSLLVYIWFTSQCVKVTQYKCGEEAGGK